MKAILAILAATLFVVTQASYTTSPPGTPQDCIVSDWASYGNHGSNPCTSCPPPPPCSKTCGGGIRTDTRVVLVPAANGGAPCPSLSRTVECNTQACPVDCVVSEWAQYDSYEQYSVALSGQHTLDPSVWGGLCSKTCGGGTRQLFRRILREPTNGGLECPQLIKTISCNTVACPIDCVVSQWAFFDDYQVYASQYGPNVPFTQYNWAGVCTKTCGGGLRHKFRFIVTAPMNNGKACPVLFETVPCNVDPCPEDCVVSEWAVYPSYEACSKALVPHGIAISLADYTGSCTVSCGGGIRTAYRYVVSFPKNGGLECPPLTKNITCNQQPCPVDCQVSQWSYYHSYHDYYNVFNGYAEMYPDYAWHGACSKTCGGGVRTHYRKITQYPQNGGKACPPTTKTVSCNTQACPVDCVVSEWAVYNHYNDYSQHMHDMPNYAPSADVWQGLCSASCGGGSRLRFRKVVQFPENGGAECPPLQESVSCNNSPCPVDCIVSQWVAFATYAEYETEMSHKSPMLSPSDWQGLCTRTCGGGIRRFFRYVIQHDAYGGAMCPSLYKDVPCNTQECPTDCVVSEWTQYSSYGAYYAAMSPYGSVDSETSFRGSCSKSCGGGTRFLYRYVITPSQNMGMPCPPLSKEVPCNTHSCPMDCVVGPWATYSSYDSYYDANHMYPGCVDYVNFHGQCSKTCGGGVRSVYRHIISVPQFGGKECPPLTKTVPCNTQNCPVDCVVSEWTEYSSYAYYLTQSQYSHNVPMSEHEFLGQCTKSCGGGTRTVYRLVLTAAAYGGVACPILSKQVPCNTFDCPIDCVVSQWVAYDSYHHYNLDCDHYGSQPIPAIYFSGLCSKSCNTGTRTIFRFIITRPANNGKECPALYKDVPCNAFPCPTDCVVSEWTHIDPVTGAYAQCTATCGMGVRTLRRSVIHPAGFGGQACPPLSMTESCNIQPCPVDCIVSQWASFETYEHYYSTMSTYGTCMGPNVWGGQCTKTCGGGIRSIFRYIVSPPQHGGKACPALVKTVPCNTKTCPGDCVVSEWAQYSSYEEYVNAMNHYGSPYADNQYFHGTCSASCGGGYRELYRVVVTPPTYGGAPCPDLSKIVSCNTQPCPVDCVVGSWAPFHNYDVYVNQMGMYGPVDALFEWKGQCSKTCGGGIRTVYRTVVTHSAYGGKECPPLTKTVKCNTQACPIDCAVSEWLDVGATNLATTGAGLCSKSCGGGNKAQIRRVITYPSADGVPCPILYRTVPCNDHPCPVDCIVSNWATYATYQEYFNVFQGYSYLEAEPAWGGKCSRTCGEGTQSQYRYIVQEPAHGGAACPPLTKVISCNKGGCPGDCVVSDWAPFDNYVSGEIGRAHV